MNAATQWWLYSTPAGRRLLGRMLPASAVPPAVARQMCAEQGHDRRPGLDRCARCGAPK